LHKLVDALNSEANLTASGRKRWDSNIVSALVNRLRVEDYLQKHPDLMQRPVARPIRFRSAAHRHDADDQPAALKIPRDDRGQTTHGQVFGRWPQPRLQ
jgi:hypothetical protein